MCDFSLAHVRSRVAKVGDKLVTKDFGTGTRGFAAIDDLGCAVCLMPGTEIAFDELIVKHEGYYNSKTKNLGHKVAVFRQINKDNRTVHHDALETPDGEIVLLTKLGKDQHATVLQLPAEPRTEAERQDQQRLEMVS